MTEVDQAPAGAWARRLLVLLFAGLLIALPAGWISSQYMGNSLNPILSYNVQDGWCEAGVFPGVGAHCFGDYTQSALIAEHDFHLSDRDFAKQGPYLTDPTIAYNSLYPPISQFPHAVVTMLRLHVIGGEATFYLYAALLVLAMLLPAIWVAWMWRGSPFALAPLLLIGIATVPVFSMFDRGNSAGFVVPFLLLFGIFLGRDPEWVAPVAVLAAALVRPQFIVLALGLVAVRRLRQAVGTVAAFLIITLASFLVMPGGPIASFQAWRANVTGFKGGFGDLTWDMPPNMSVARGLVATGQLMQEWPSYARVFGGWLATSVVEHPLAPSLLLAFIALVVLGMASDAVPRSVAVVLPLVLATTFPGTVPGYYLVFALVIGALVLGPRLVAGGPSGGMLDDERAPWYWGWPVIIMTTLSLAPLTFTMDSPPGLPIPRGSAVLEWVGRGWLVVVVLGLVLVLIRRARPQPAPS